MTRFRSWMGMLSAASVLLVAGAAAADDDGLESLLEERVVTTPSKSSETATVAPGTTSVLTAEDLRRYGIRSLDEAINYLSLGMTATNPQHAVEVGSRGVLLTADYGNHVLLLVDGHSLNEPWNGTAYFERGAGIPFELVDHIEVTLGPGSVLYGAQAMLGVINIVTKRAKDYHGVHVIGEGELAAPTHADGSVSMDGLGTGYRLGAGFGREMTWFGVPAEATLQVEYYTQHGPAFEYAPQSGIVDSVTGQPKAFGPKSPPGSWGGTVRDSLYTQVPTAFGRLVIGDFEVFGRVGMYRRGTAYLDSIVSDSGEFDNPDSNERDRFANLEVRHRASLSATVVVRSRAYADVNEYTWNSVTSAAEDCPPGMGAGCTRNLVGVGSTLGAEVSSSFDWLHTGRLVTLLGVDGKVRNAHANNEVIDASTGKRWALTDPTHDTDGLLAVYLEQTAQPVRPLLLNAGVRADRDPRFGGRVSPRVAIGVTPWSTGQLKTVYSEAFRGPSNYELTYSDPNDVIAAPNLRAETVRSLELSFDQRIATHRVLFGVFRSWWDDMVAQGTASDAELAGAIASGALAPGTETAYVYRNASRIDNYGLNLGWEGTGIERRLHYALNVTEAVSKKDPGDGTPIVPITVGPQIFGNARVAYDLPDHLPTVALAAQYQARRPADRAFDGGFTVSPFAPPVLSLRFTLSGDVPSVPGLSYRVSATYATQGRGPYVVGPTQYAYDATSRAALSPFSRLNAFAGLEYVFGK
jgi:outer membrane receptor for ferrienterochelin and colicins